MKILLRQMWHTHLREIVEVEVLPRKGEKLSTPDRVFYVDSVDIFMRDKDTRDWDGIAACVFVDGDRVRDIDGRTI